MKGPTQRYDPSSCADVYQTVSFLFVFPTPYPVSFNDVRCIWFMLCDALVVFVPRSAQLLNATVDHTWFAVYWIGLGFLSSFGFGTSGLYTYGCSHGPFS